MSGEVTDLDAKRALFAEGTTPWHGRGLTVDGWLSLEQIRAAFMMDLMPEPAEVSYAGKRMRVPGNNVLLRVDKDALEHVTKDSAQGQPLVMCTYGNRRQIFTYEDLLIAPTEAILEAGLAPGASSAFTMRDGARGAISLPVGDPFVIGTMSDGTVDKVEQYHTLVAGIDNATGNLSVESQIRAVCANTVKVAKMMAVEGRGWKGIKSTANMKSKLAEAVEAHIAQSDVVKLMHEGIEQLLESPFTEEDFHNLLDDPKIQGPRPVTAEGEKSNLETRWETRRDSLVDYYWNEDLNPVGHIRDTKYGALNTVQGWEQHMQPTRGNDDAEGRNLARYLFGDAGGTPMADAALRALTVV